ncbi:Type II/IV secretion system ATP hydrolase TadA/VirB11/CpaF, TadA subfamily [Luteococcus japonicus LSP_Lj1]|uniref:Type II/IV secretion system ATP hydrolase TadA/VirB11/CpaF, TadA subfamily n=1 Tax=Luteococcus japonicus LSP_Lj1 TaxID=1255658 RepID=A0A1R4JAC7_9ACTN|nr:Type II/IV secretion system ATP hydrolase TadA/VirB11/CpaF, TadA subfamily [Luteococcus japonicus LSP_Lj1]
MRPQWSRDTTGVDWDVVVRLRRRASEEITDVSEHWSSDRGRAMAPEDRRMMGRSVIRQVVRQHAETLALEGQALWDIELEQAYAAAVENAIFGYGRLQPLFEIPDAENIEIHGWDSVMVQYGDGRRVAHPPVADSDEELVEAIRFLGESASPSRPFDDAHPMMTLGDSRNFCG